MFQVRKEIQFGNGCICQPTVVQQQLTEAEHLWKESSVLLSKSKKIFMRDVGETISFKLFRIFVMKRHSRKQ
jgi:hypothetical protein